MKYEQFGRCVGKKFNMDKTARRFPGNTVISPLDRSGEIFDLFRGVRAYLTEKPCARCVSFLPDESLHMTVIEGVCDQVRDAAHWTSLLPADARLTDVDDLFAARFADLPGLGTVRMRPTHVEAGGAITLRLTPETDADDKRIRAYRDLVGDALGLRFPGHDTYGFHISIGYGVLVPTQEETAQFVRFEEEARAYIERRDVRFAIRPPVLTFFDDMLFFHTERVARG